MKGALSTLSADSARVLTLQGQLIQEVVLAEELQKAENQQERCLRHLEAEVLAEAAAGPSSVARHDCNDFWEASTEQHEDQNMQALLRQAGSFLFGNDLDPHSLSLRPLTQVETQGTQIVSANQTLKTGSEIVVVILVGSIVAGVALDESSSPPLLLLRLLRHRLLILLLVPNIPENPLKALVRPASGVDFSLVAGAGSEMQPGA